MKLSGILGFVVVCILTGCGAGELDGFSPSTGDAFAAPFRTMAEHDSLMQDRSWPYLVELESRSGSLLYYGSWHTNDPGNPQITEIQRRWQAFNPTVAVTENRLGWYLGGLNRAVSAHGEFGAVLHLARRDDVPIYTLEPTWEDEVAEVTRVFPVEEATLFYTLRVFLSERGEGRSPEDIDRLAAHLLRKRGGRPGLEGSLPDLDALDTLWNERFAELGPWRTLPREAIDPHPDPTHLQAIANLVNEVRDRHAARVTLELMSRGERVFAIAGGSHVVKQEPVLRASIR